MATLTEFVIYSVINLFTTSLALALTDWIFKKRIEKALTTFEDHIKAKLNRGDNNGNTKTEHEDSKAA